MTDATDTARAFAIATGVAFDPAGHTYSVDGRRLPSVTQILQAVGMAEIPVGIPSDRLAYKRSVGIAVHAAILFMLDDDLDLISVDPAIAGYLTAFDRFRTETQFRPERD